MDESGLRTGDRYLTVAGYVAQATEWDKFDERWRWELREFMRNVTENKRYFHALDFYENKPPYRTWSSGKKNAFITALFDAINTFDLDVFSATVDSDMFSSMTMDERRFLTGGIHNGLKWKTSGAPKSPWYLPFQFCIIHATNFLPDHDRMFAVMS